jgi:hypothetical protein
VAEPGDLARRVAATCVGLATGPFRVQQPHWRAATLRLISLAERWAARAERATTVRSPRSGRRSVFPEQILTSTSSSPHVEA